MIKLDSVETVGKTDKLKPCPFCGRKVDFKPFEFGDKLYMVVCPNCGSRTTFHDNMENNFGKSETCEAWNRRADNE